MSESTQVLKKDHSTQRSLLAVGGILALMVLMILLNGLSELLFGRFYVDLTADGLYSLSPGTKNIVKSLSEPITIKTYLSRTDGAKYPAIKMYGDRVVTLLHEYERAAGGKIKVEIYDPRPDTDEESWAQKFGLTPFDMPDGAKIFFGLAAVNARGDEEVIPVFSLARQEFLEYDISRLLYSLSAEKKPVIGVLTSLPMKGQDAQMADMMHPQRGGDPWLVVGQLSNFADIHWVESTAAKIDDDVSLLMVIHPKNLSDATRYAIDQFVMRGGNLFVAEDPYCNVDRPGNQQDPSAMFAEKSSDLNALLKNWGVEMVEKKAVGDINLATKVNAGGGQPIDFPLWVSLRKSSDKGSEVLNHDDMTTSQIDNLLLAWPGALKLTKVEGVTSVPLLQTTSEAMLFDEADYRYGGGSPDAVMAKYHRGSQVQVMGVRLTGKFKSTFSAPPANDGKSAEAPAPFLSESKAESSIVVVADVDFLSDESSAVTQNFLGAKMVSLLNHNLVFAGNVAENLLGSSDLISLRSRGQYTRPFTRVQQIEQRAEERFRQEKMLFESEINAANQRLTQLQSGSEQGSGEQVVNKAMLDEMKKLREQRADAQERLRNVRRKLRQDKERLGDWLFVLNTFAVPFCLVIGVILWPKLRRKSAVA